MNVWSLARNCVAAFIIVLTGTSAVAQNPGNGNYPFARFDSFGFDSINPGDLNVHFVIPIVSKAGRGLPFQYSLAYDGLIWTPAPVNSSTVWVADPSFGMHGYLLNEGYKGYLSYSDFWRKCFYDPTDPRLWTMAETKKYFEYHDEFGVIHSFN